MNKKLINRYVGKRFGKLTVTSVHRYRADGDYSKQARTYAMCDCECGGCCFAPMSNLKQFHTMSCGCEGTGRKIDHGDACKQYRSPTYNSWRAMRDRCLNPNNNRYELYGGRGITICPEWSSYKKFKEDMGERPHGTTIDRINNSGNYEPSNCRWADKFTQARNRSR